MSRSNLDVDVLIAGGGIVGLALAIALRQGLGRSFSVAVADPTLANARADGRATAIVAAAKRLLAAIGVGDASEAQPLLDMVVTDSALDDTMRPTFLTFSGDVEPGEPFGHMVENGPLLAALAAKAKGEGVMLHPVAVQVSPAAWGESEGLDREASPIPVELVGAERLTAALLVGADGAHSAVRESAGIAVHGWSYGQSAIVTTVTHERDHRGRAEEHFLPAGPFAILPLQGNATAANRSSLVWTETDAEAARLIALSDDDFHEELERRFGLHLGDIAVAGPRRAYPLGLFIARAFVSERIALVGDAAHVIHPIAGQGL